MATCYYAHFTKVTAPMNSAIILRRCTLHDRKQAVSAAYS